jgi:hypothetical protein
MRLPLGPIKKSEQFGTDSVARLVNDPSVGLSWSECVMTEAVEFRRRAQECIDMAPKMGPESRPLLLSIAEAWTALAHAAEAKEFVSPPRTVESHNLH